MSDVDRFRLAGEAFEKAVRSVEETLESLKGFRGASDSLRESARQSGAALEGLRQAAELVRVGAEHLCQEGVGAFRIELGEQLGSGYERVVGEISSAAEKSSKAFDLYSRGLSEALESRHAELIKLGESIQQQAEQFRVWIAEQFRDQEASALRWQEESADRIGRVESVLRRRALWITVFVVLNLLGLGGVALMVYALRSP